MITDGEQFNDVIFTDESTCQVEYHARRAYRRIGEPRILRQRPKHPAKIHAWAEISKRGATQLVLFQGIMTATRYTTILDASLIPFIQTTYPDGHRFLQDNDPKHTSRWAKSYFEDNINWWHSPPESPDLNPIELVWGSMKETIRNYYKPRTLDALKESLLDYWVKNIMTPNVCSRYIDHLQRVLPAVVEANGQATGY